MVLALRKAFPRVAVSMLLQHYTGAIVEGHPCVEEILWYDAEGQLVPFLAMLRTIRARRFDAVVVARPTGRLAWLMFLARIPVRLGTGYRYYSLLFNRRVFEHRKDARRHELEYNLNLLAPLGISAEANRGPVSFGITVSPDEERAAKNILIANGVVPDRPFAVIHPGTGGSAREWQLGNFGDLGARLNSRKRLPIVVTGSLSEEELVRTLVQIIGGGAVPLDGKLSLRELAAVLRLASVWIGHSTGPLHLAVAVGTPVVGLYPQLLPMSPTRWGPYSDRSRVHVPDRPTDCTECVGGKLGHCPCMDTITVNEVFRSVEELLADGESLGS
jgi:heptosyltransferase-2